MWPLRQTLLVLILLGAAVTDASPARADGGWTLPVEREHEWGETARYVGLLYGASWVGYFATQPKTFLENGSPALYRENFGRAVLFDHDPPWYNWMIHPTTGSQLYLFFRARGYDRRSAFALTALQSFLFETTVEIYTEKASFEDMINTPVLGGVLGHGLELLSLHLLNRESKVARFFGYLVNPMALLGLHEGAPRAVIVPGARPALALTWSFH